MTPQEQERMDKLEKTVNSLVNVINVPFIEQIKRRIVTAEVETQLSTLTLSDLSDVEGTDTATTGQVLKKTATTWQPGTDNIA